MLLRSFSLLLLAGIPSLGGAWLYVHSDLWPEVDPGCGGAAQSPINIETAHATTGEAEQPLEYSYKPQDAGALTLVNDGHFLGVNGQFGTLTLPDGQYNALQLRIHFPSEHEIDGIAFVGELQIFHQREGAKGNEGLAVVAIPLRSSQEVANTPAGDAEKALFKGLGLDGTRPPPAVQGQTATTGLVDLGAFQQRLDGTYYHYAGSLTNPPCFQGVHWYVLEEAAVFPAGALDFLKDVLTESVSRPVQPLHDRKIVRNHLSLPGEFPKTTGILFDCKATGEWIAPQRTWCCDEQQLGCLAPHDDPASWPSSFPKCAGTHQSPIDVIAASAMKPPNQEPLSFYYVPQSQTTVVNDGRSLQVVGKLGFLKLPDGPYDAMYLRIVFPSEHHKNGQSADGELQIVHRRRGCTGDCTAIVSLPLVLPQPGQAVPDRDRQLFRTVGLGPGLSPPAEQKSAVAEGSVDLNVFRSQLTGVYHHYVGSLTEPPCTENVHWYLVAAPIVVAAEVVDAFKGHFTTAQYRPVQPLNDRTVVKSNLGLLGEFDVPAAPGGQMPTEAPEAPAPYDCTLYQSSEAARQWCAKHEKVQQFRLPHWTWSYDQPAAWPSVSPTCGGSEQSPVDLHRQDVAAIEDPHALRYDYYAFEATGERKIINDGRSLRVDGDFGNLVLPDGLYQVKHFLFHFPSEHTIDGQPALGELQILHQKQGSHGVEDVAIVSLLLASEDSAGRPCEGEEKEFFQSLGFGDGGRLPEPGQEVGSFGRVDLNVFHRQLKGHFFHYKGSLTVPPCMEGLHWYVLEQPAAVAADMIASFDRLFPSAKHVRPTQPLNGREVLMSHIGLPGEYGVHMASYAVGGPEVVVLTTTLGATIECPFDCRSHEPADEEKREWCCGHEGLLCEGQKIGASHDPHTVARTAARFAATTAAPTTAAPTTAAPTTAAPTSASPTLPPLPPEETNCDLFWERWEVAWTHTKKAYCCDTAGRACDPYDCSYEYDHWRVRWPREKKEWCCHHHRRGCHDNSDQPGGNERIGIGDAGRRKPKPAPKPTPKPAPKPHPKPHPKPAPTPAPAADPEPEPAPEPFGRVREGARSILYDCTDDDDWMTSWTPIKKDWCCQHEDVHCFQGYDCATGYPSSVSSWNQDQKNWCCENEHKGCDAERQRSSWGSPTEWGRRFANCKGTIQSPINIMTAQADRGNSATPLQYTYNTVGGGLLTSTGYALVVHGDFGTVTLPDGVYKATSLQFHFPSDHMVDGRNSDGEMQVVYERGGHRAMASILLVLPENGADVPRREEQMAFFRAFGFEGMTTMELADVKPAGALSLGAFKPQMDGEYYHYVGSQTMPPCAEHVHWYVHKDHAVILPQTLDAFKRLGGSHPTNRPAQPLNGREVVINSPSVDGEFDVLQVSVQVEWDYKDPHSWVATYPSCGGHVQSPIYIDPKQTRTGGPAQPLEFTYHPVARAALVNTGVPNTGHGLEVRGPFGSLKLPDGEYQASQFFFHFPAEHKVIGSAHIGELQILHERREKPRTGHAIIAIRLVDGVMDPAHKSFFRNVGLGAGAVLPGRTAHVESEQPVDLGIFSPQMGGGYYHYEGSLTTPPCLEYAHWYVLEETVAVSADVVASFKPLFPQYGNNRPLQPLHGRKVVESRIAVPMEFGKLTPPQYGRRPGGGVFEYGRDQQPEGRGRESQSGGRGRQSGGEASRGDLPFDCDAGLEHWRNGWSRKKKSWCCENEEKGCVQYNCKDVSRMDEWKQAKKDWCCEKRSVGCEMTEAVDWSYADPGKWSFKYPSCIGTKQSPISISDDARKNLGKIQHLTASYEPIGGLKLENTGHELKVSGPLGRFALPNGIYEAKEIRFHFPSEHKVDGLLAAGEMEIVHQRRGSSDNDDLAILSILLHISKGGDEDHSEVEFFKNLGFGVPGGLPAKGAPAKAIPKEVDLEVFRNQIRGRYFHYEGSLTTPPCSETVHWYVAQEPAIVEIGMVSAFKAIFPDPANNRPVQPLTDREVVESRLRVRGTCEFRHESGCQKSGGIAGWFQGLLGQSMLGGLALPSGASAHWWLVASGLAMATAAVVVRAVRAPRRERYQALLCQDARGMASRSCQLSSKPLAE